jgi:hypothetical protein
MFAQRLAWHSIARVTRALYDAGIPCPSAADPSGTRTALSGVDAGERWRRSWRNHGIPAGRCGTCSAPTSTW